MLVLEIIAGIVLLILAIRFGFFGFLVEIILALLSGGSSSGGGGGFGGGDSGGGGSDSDF